MLFCRHRPPLRRACSQRGQSLVEFALVTPVLFMLTVGLIDVGRAFYQYNGAANATREAARFASVYGGSQHPEFDWAGDHNGNKPGTYSLANGYPVSGFAGSATTVGTIARYALGTDLNALTVTISAPSGASPRQPIEVTMVDTFQPLTGLFLGGLSFSLTASSQMIIE